jgi:hypothetical protein
MSWCVPHLEYEPAASDDENAFGQHTNWVGFDEEIYNSAITNFAMIATSHTACSTMPPHHNSTCPGNSRATKRANVCNLLQRKLDTRNAAMGIPYAENQCMTFTFKHMYIEPEPQPAEFSGPIWAVARPQAKNRGPAVPVRCHAVLGRTHTCLLAYWRTGLLVLVQGSWYYVYVSYTTNAGTNGPQPAAATTKKLRPGRGRPRHKKRAAAGRNCGRPRLCGRLRPTGPDVMHC